MTIQTTCSIIKPDAVKAGVAGQIIQRLEDEGFRIAACKRIHLTQRQSIPIWYDAGLLAITAWTGIFLAIVSLHTVQGIVQSYLGTFLSWGFALIVIGLSGYGVYLGRFLRWNSWDVISDPVGIAYDSLDPLINPITNADKIGFMIMYTSLFLVTYLTYAWLRPFNHTTEKQTEGRLENVHNV